MNLVASYLLKCATVTSADQKSLNPSPQSMVNIKVGLVAPEGAGSYVYCRHRNLIDHSSHAIALDFGTGTIIPTVFTPGGSIEFREVLSVGGCVDLLDALARERELQIYEGGKLGDIELKSLLLFQLP